MHYSFNFPTCFNLFLILLYWFFFQFTRNTVAARWENTTYFLSNIMIISWEIRKFHLLFCVLLYSNKNFTKIPNSFHLQGYKVKLEYILHMNDIEEENNGYIVFKWNIHGSAGKYSSRICKRLGAQESRNRFCQPIWMEPGGPVRHIGLSDPPSWESIHGLLKRFTNSSNVDGWGGVTLPTPHAFIQYSRLLDRYLKTTWTVFPLSWIFLVVLYLARCAEYRRLLQGSSKSSLKRN